MVLVTNYCKKCGKYFKSKPQILYCEECSLEIQYNTAKLILNQNKRIYNSMKISNINKYNKLVFNKKI